MDVVQRSRRHAPAEHHGIHPVCWMPPASALSTRWIVGALDSNRNALPPFGRSCSRRDRIGEPPIDSRIKIADDGTIQTLTSRMGTGGMNVPLVMKIRSGCEGGGKGPLIQEDKSATLGCNNDQTLFEPVAFGISSDQSKAMLSSNPHAGIYKARTSRTWTPGVETQAAIKAGLPWSHRRSPTP